jgi:IS5 family transposase
VVALARQLKVTRGRKLRVDTTAVETNVHHPTDGSLLADGIRVLGRLVRRAKPAVGAVSGLGQREFVSHTRSARKWVRLIHGVARRVREAQKQTGKEGKGTPVRRGDKQRPAAGETTAVEKKRRRAQEAMKEAYGRLIHVAQRSVAQAKRVGAALRERPGAAATKIGAAPMSSP